MGFTQGVPPDIEPAEFNGLPLMERVRIAHTHWVDHGFGTPKMINVIYLFKVLILQIGIGITLATLSSGFNPLDVGSWWNELIVYQKAILWTMLLEIMGLGGTWGPLCGRFKPMTGGVLYWTRVGGIRLPPWPDRVPGTRGDRRSLFDVVLYCVILANLLLAVVLPGVAARGMADQSVVNPIVVMPLVVLLVVMGLRDKVIFIASRGEQYYPAIVFFSFLPFVDIVVALKLLIVTVWVGAGVSKLGKHFSHVIPPMISNTPWVVLKSVKRAHYRRYPEDLRPSRMASGIAHVLGTLVEIVAPLVLLFSTNIHLSIGAAVLMVCFHLFIFSTFPLAVPLEWNILFAFATIVLFLGFPNQDGFGVTDFSSPFLLALIVAGLVFFPILGNLRPDLVSFLPSMRQYAGNWATALWAFAPGAEAKIDEFIDRPAKTTPVQLESMYEPDVARMTLDLTLGWRSLHSNGRGLFSLLMHHLGEDLENYDVREAEFAANTIIGFNFGDGHLHDHRLIAAIQKRVGYAPGEFVVVWMESQPIHKGTQQYKIIDAALGIIEEGYVMVADEVEALPHLPNGPIPRYTTWRAETGGQTTAGPRTADHHAADHNSPSKPTAAHNTMSEPAADEAVSS